jgi:hypothetical protein
MQVRKADLGKPDLAARTVPLVLATDYPVQRSGYVEVLDIARVDLSRGDLPLIESHDAQRLNIGVIATSAPKAGSCAAWPCSAHPHAPAKSWPMCRPAS